VAILIDTTQQAATTCFSTLYLRASMTNSKSGRLCDPALMRKGAFLRNLTGKGWIYECFDGIVFFE